MTKRQATEEARLWTLELSDLTLKARQKKLSRGEQQYLDICLERLSYLVGTGHVDWEFVRRNGERYRTVVASLGFDRIDA